jgi:iron complex outermembrane receptor protein
MAYGKPGSIGMRPLLLIVSTLAPLGATFAQTASPAGSQASEPSTLETIIVTAQKRAEALQDVPIAITALTADTLEKAGGSDLSDFAGLVPGLQFQSDRAGENRTTIRGISEIAGGAPSVGVYMDETPITTFSGEQVNLKAFDIERIEVLRGPQGTLYGEGSEGGTIRVVTQKPNTTQTDGAVRVTSSDTSGGGFNGEFDGMVNLPLIADKLAIRLVGMYSNYNGWIDNPVLGDDHYNKNTSNTERATLRFTPDDRWTIDLGYLRQYSNSDGPNNANANYQYFGATPEPRNDRFDIYSLTANGQLGFATFTSATGYFTRSSLSHNDFTSIAPILGFLLGAPVNTAAIVRPNGQKILTEEARLVSSLPGPLSWTVGLFYKHDNLDIANSTITNPVVPLPVFNLDVEDTNTQYAVFGEADYALTDPLHLLVGVRYFEQHRDTSSTVGGLLPFVLGAGASTQQQTASASHTTPKISLNYRLTPAALLYVTASSGFRAGDINPYSYLFPGSPTSFGPETLWNYELGAKTSWLGNRLVLNAALFRINWSNVIINSQVASSAGELFGYSVNGGKAHSHGVEFELSAIPATGLEFSFGGSVTEARIDDAVPSVQAMAGATLPFVPKRQLYTAVQYTFPLPGSGSLQGRIRADARYKSDSYSDVTDAPLEVNTGYTQTNFRAGVAAQTWDLMGFVDNLANTRGENGWVSPGVSTLIRPRTVGLTLNMHF